MPNDGYIPNLPQGMAVEVPALVDGRGIHPVRMDKPLPVAITQMIAAQGAIQQLLIEAYQESPATLLRMLIAPGIYLRNAVAPSRHVRPHEGNLPELWLARPPNLQYYVYDREQGLCSATAMPAA